MRKTVFIILPFVFAFGCLAHAEQQADPLPNYGEQFEKADALIRSLDATTSITNAFAWIEQAIEAKEELDAKDEIRPWLIKLAESNLDNWRIQCVVAEGFRQALSLDWKERQWNRIQRMDRAYILLQEDEICSPDERLTVYNNYISYLLPYGDQSYRLLLKTVETPYEEWSKQDVGLEKHYATNMLERLHFFDFPTSYTDAANDGELLRLLLKEQSKLCTDEDDLTMDCAVLTAGVHINMPDLFNEYGEEYIAAPFAREIVSNLANDETVVWGENTNDYRIVKLPEDYQYIPAFEQLAGQGDQQAAKKLGIIFRNRSQMERAAHWFEMAGCINEVREIRANQGILLPHRSFMYEDPVAVDYYFRNGSEIELELYPIKAGQNLLQRLITDEVMESEINLLLGDPNDFMEFYPTNYAGLLGAQITHWTQPLSPLPDHRDTVQTITVPELLPGNYLLRAEMKDGNRTETVLHIFDTVLYHTQYFDEEDPGGSSYLNDELYLLCDARTGEPRTYMDIHNCYLLGGIERVGKKRRDGANTLYEYVRKSTGSDGVYRSGDVSYGWIVVDPSPSTPFVSESGRLELDVYTPNEHDYIDRYDSIFQTTDRPIYRPGDTGYMKVWNPFKWDEDISDYTIKSYEKNFSIPLETSAPTNRYGNLILDSFGGGEYTFHIPEDAPLGQYSYYQPWYSSYSSDRNSFRVEEYRAPEFRFHSEVNEEQQIQITSAYSYGKPLSGGSLRGSVNFVESDVHWFYPKAPLDPAWGKGYWWNGAQFTPEQEEPHNYDMPHRTYFTNELNSAGHICIDPSTITNGLSGLEIPGYFSLDLTLTDPSGKTFSNWEILPSPTAYGPDFCCWLDKAFYSTNETITCHTAFDNNYGDLDLKIYSLADTNAVAIQRIPLTKPTVELAPFPGGTYAAQLISDSGESSQPFEFAVIDDQSTILSEEDPVRIVVEKGLYYSNETARILIQVDQPGRYVYWFPHADAEEGGFSRPDVFKMESVSKVVELPLNPDYDEGVVQSAAFTIVNGEPHLATCLITVPSDRFDIGQIEVTPDKEEYKPGEDVALSIRTLDSTGQGRPASVTLSIYNKTLDLWLGNNPPQLMKFVASFWKNCIRQTVSADKKEWPEINPLSPEWVMKAFQIRSPIAPFGYYGIPGSSSFSVFGSAISVDENDPLDAEKENSELRIREDFRDLAYWNATIITDSNGCANVSFPMPDGLVEWKIKAWALDTDYAAESETLVRCSKDFVAQLNTPRFMTEGDKLELFTAVRNYTTNIVSGTANLSADTSALQIESPERTAIDHLEPDSEKLIYWNTRAAEVGTVGVTTSVEGTNDFDAMKISFPILPHGMIKRGGHGGVTTGTNRTASFEIVIPKTTETVDFQLHTTPNMLEALNGALPYLADYPYGCTEQTLNRFLPSLVVMQTQQQLGIEMPEAATNMPPEREAVLLPEEIRKRAQAGIDKLEVAKNHNGWGWNTDSSSPHDALITAWVTRGLDIASLTAGLDVSRPSIKEAVENMLDEMDRQLTEAENPTNKVEVSNIDAFEALVVSEIGTEDASRYEISPEQNRKTLTAYSDLLFDHADQLSLYGKTLLANAYAIQGNVEKRDRLIAFIDQYLEHDDATGMVRLRTQSKDDWWYWYNDEIELHAWYLKLLTRTDPHGERAAGVVRYLMQNRIYGDHWKSTRDTAIAIEALAEFAKNNPGDPTEGAASIVLNGNVIEDPTTARLHPGTNSLTLSSSNGSPIFFDAVWSSYSNENPITEERCDLFSIDRTYSRVCTDTNIIIQAGDPVQIGELIEVELIITAAQPLEYLMAEDHKPAGFEALPANSGYSYTDRSYREFHDERVSFYLSSIPKGITRLRYRIRAEHAGKVCALPATIELMYEPRQAANSAERKLQINRTP